MGKVYRSCSIKCRARSERWTWLWMGWTHTHSSQRNETKQKQALKNKLYMECVRNTVFLLTDTLSGVCCDHACQSVTCNDDASHLHWAGYSTLQYFRIFRERWNDPDIRQRFGRVFAMSPLIYELSRSSPCLAPFLIPFPASVKFPFPKLQFCIVNIDWFQRC